MQINLHDPMVAEKDIEDAVGGGWTDGNRKSGTASTNAKLPTSETDATDQINLSDLIVQAVLDWRKRSRHLTGAGLVMTRWSVHAERLVGSLQVVSIAPAIERSLSVIEITKGRPAEQLVVEGAMKPFVFALGLRMVRPGVTDVDA